ncbi:hypothetical protein PAXRUDRAFT_821732 [Paxillus rubicundulus Ve08.2h10]|uniref:Uncharacterized protein n=1 Tax=Paxillus rubicundulus Ve08.2h10 TaxID=930991 RepID=A0A0D0DXP6_9AGAM|nr:hypothetical protein PAXRUDRAFT_821732 [Paxillus rubicundulus Ve08.2h10]
MTQIKLVREERLISLDLLVLDPSSCRFNARRTSTIPDDNQICQGPGNLTATHQPESCDRGANEFSLCRKTACSKRNTSSRTPYY